LLSRAGEAASAAAFSVWAERTLVPRLQRGEDPHTRYTADGREGPVERSTFQLNGFGLLLWARRHHRERHRDPEHSELATTSSGLASARRDASSRQSASGSSARTSSAAG
jgi:hypothetical protein